jgi:myosin III
MTVAIKVQRYDEEHKLHIEEEYRTLRDCPEHPNILQFYGVFMKRNSSPPHEIWFILEYCHYGAIMDTVKALHSQKRSLKELHVAYIMRQVVRALIHLHDQGIMHRDVRGSNILLNRAGEIKLGDYGLSRDTAKCGNKRYTSIGSPHWMSPEMVKSDQNQRQPKKRADGEEEEAGYDNRADVWAIGITALELAEGRVPFEHMHPTRVLFQIVKNPPPTLFKVSNWTQDFNDFTIE